MIEWFERCGRMPEVVRDKRNGVVTAIAFQCCDEVSWVFSDCRRAVMAGRTRA